MTSSIDNLKKGLLSVFIAAILGLQLMPIVSKMSDKPWGGYYWPFTDYPMYMGAHKEGDHVRAGYSVTATLSNGEERLLTFNDYGVLGMNYFMFQHLCTKLSSDNGHLYAAEFTALHPEGDEIVKLDVYNNPVVVTRHGPKEVEAELLNSIVLDSGKEDAK